MNLDEMGRSWAYEQIDREVMRGFAGLGMLLLAIIVGDVVSEWLGWLLCIGGLWAVTLAFLRLA